VAAAYLFTLVAMSAWQNIRQLRSQPPPRVTNDRLGVFASALEQAEHLMHAAANISYAARPLPLFYALSQAGRAIAAARLAGDAWRLAGHGLSMSKDGTELLKRIVVPNVERTGKPLARPNSFAGVSEATGSGRLSGGVALGAVWAAMPDLTRPTPQMPTLDDDWRRPLRAYPLLPQSKAAKLVLLLDGLPDGLNATQINAELAHYTIPFPTGVLTPGTAGQMLNARNFSAFDPTIVNPSGAFQRPEKPDGPLYSFHGGKRLPAIIVPSVTLVAGQQDSRIDQVAPRYSGKPDALICPRLGERPVTRLMLWWLLLFILSNAARYDPELWTNALAVNTSQEAVPLEAALDIALDLVPELVLQALTAE
jgi:hypothetical protein